MFSASTAPLVIRPLSAAGYCALVGRIPATASSSFNTNCITCSPRSTADGFGFGNAEVLFEQRNISVPGIELKVLESTQEAGFRLHVFFQRSPRSPAPCLHSPKRYGRFDACIAVVPFFPEPGEGCIGYAGCDGGHALLIASSCVGIVRQSFVIEETIVIEHLRIGCIQYDRRFFRRGPVVCLREFIGRHQVQLFTGCQRDD